MRSTKHDMPDPQTARSTGGLPVVAPAPGRGTPRASWWVFALGLALLLGACASPPQKTTQSPQLDPTRRSEVVLTALSLLETDYRYGGSQPSRGFDCSGLVKYVFDAATDTALPHNTAQIARISRPIPRSELRPGDLVFFNTLGRSNSHMGIYMGGGRFINAPSTGGEVRIDTLNNTYYRRHFESARTLFSQ